MLIEVIDSLSRKIEYKYKIDEVYNESLLEKVIDFTGREILFNYNDEPQLLSVRSPVVIGTNGNDFPNGKTWQYTYDTENDSLPLKTNILTVISPNEVSNGSLTPCIVNTYNENDEIISQFLGGTNSSNSPSGGMITYARELITDQSVRSIETTVVDRNNNVTLFEFNGFYHARRKVEFTKGLRTNEPESYTTQWFYLGTSTIAARSDGLIRTKILPKGDRIIYGYDENNSDLCQRGNVTVSTHSDSTGTQRLRRAFVREPISQQILMTAGERGTDNTFIPPNGGTTSLQRYETKYTYDYMENGLDTPLASGFTLRQLTEKYGLSLSQFVELNQGDVNGDGTVVACARPIKTKRPTANLRPGSPQVTIENGSAQAIEMFSNFNQFGQLIQTEDAEGNITEYFYFDENTPNSGGLSAAGGGYLGEVIVDSKTSVRRRSTAPLAQLSTKYELDDVGNIKKVIDPRGIATSFLINSLDQVFETTRAADISATQESGLIAHAYITRYFYDSNNNVIRTELEYRDGNNNEKLPAFIKNEVVYDILNNPISTKKTVSNSEVQEQKIVLDPNENVVENSSPLAVIGEEALNRIATIYDERDLPFVVTSAPNSPEESTKTFNYDSNANIFQVIDSEDNNQDGQNDSTLYEYDVFNRLSKVTDSALNISEIKYDPASNVIERSLFGPVDGQTGTNVLLSRQTYSHDELSRVFKTDTELFISEGVNTNRTVNLNEGDDAENGKLTSFIDYDRNSRTTFVTSPSPLTEQEVTKIEYDGVNRAIKTTGPEGDTVVVEFDKNSNAISITTTDVNPEGNVANESFITTNIFDSLNRVTSTTNNVGETQRFTYDSRNILIKTTDAQGGGGISALNAQTNSAQGAAIGNSDGNITEIIHDGLGRAIETKKSLAIDGQGGNPLDLSNPSNVDGKITEKTVWDLNSRISSVEDDNGNITTYQYDNLNRHTKTIWADLTETVNVYDKDHNLIQYIDKNGTVCSMSHDSLNRLVKKEISRSQGNNIGGTTLQEFEYDGLSRLVKAMDNNLPESQEDDAVVEFKYDSLNRTVEEIQNGKVISMNWTQSSDLKECIYPNDRKIAYSYDKLDRLKTIGDEGQTPIASYQYLGSRVLERTYKNNTRLTMLNDIGDQVVGYDGARRLTQMRHLKNDSNELLTGYEYTYNRESFKTSKKNLKNPQFSELYKLDSLYRVVDFKRGTLSGNSDTITGAPLQTQDWQIDGVGNWAKTTIDSEEKTQTVNNVNEYDSFGGVTFSHDDNGNLTDDGEKLFTYDGMNRIIEVKRKSDDELIATYKYDFMNRRTQKDFQKQTAGECDQTEGELEADSNTLTLYRFNAESKTDNRCSE